MFPVSSMILVQGNCMNEIERENGYQSVINSRETIIIISFILFCFIIKKRVPVNVLHTMCLPFHLQVICSRMEWLFYFLDFSADLQTIQRTKVHQDFGSFAVTSSFGCLLISYTALSLSPTANIFVLIKLYTIIESCLHA